MTKKAGPDLKLNLPNLRKCDAPDCKDGIREGMFHTMICDACGGFGRVDARTGEAIPQDLQVAALKRIIRQQDWVIREQQKRMPDDDFDPYGEMKKRLGGNYRMD